MKSSSREGGAAIPARGFLGLPSGIGLVVANMIGAGVLLSAGFMAQEMSAGPILLAWAFGLGVALLGARAYGAIAAVSGRSGGEYRYLSDYLHPSLGYLAGWASLLMGFSAPIAVDGVAVGAFANTLWEAEPDPRLLGTVVIVLLTLFHAWNLLLSKWTQNGLILVKVALLAFFVGLGLWAGSFAWPDWVPAEAGPGFPARSFFLQQYWIAFAFSGWNAAIYAAGEFRNPRRDVARAMMVGALGVGLFYLAVNWIFVANMTPEMATAVFEYEQTRITLAHVVMKALVGPWGGSFTSLLALLAFLSAMSAMILVGPRVYAAMAADGFLPAVFRLREGRPPVGAVLLQGGIALLLVWTHSVLQAVEGVSLVLMLSTGLTVLSVFAIRLRRDLPDPPASALVAAGLFALVIAGLIGIGLWMRRLLVLEFLVFLGLGFGTYLLARIRTRHAGTRA